MIAASANTARNVSRRYARGLMERRPMAARSYGSHSGGHRSRRPTLGAVTTVPHVDLAAALARSEPGADGAVWSIETGDLDANLVRLGPGGAVSTHRNDEVDVLVVGIDGAGTLTVDDTDVTDARDPCARRRAGLRHRAPAPRRIDDQGFRGNGTPVTPSSRSTPNAFNANDTRWY